jgi:hypothetical protein
MSPHHDGFLSDLPVSLRFDPLGHYSHRGERVDREDREDALYVPFALSEISPARWRRKVFNKTQCLQCAYCFLRGIEACPELVEGGNYCRGERDGILGLHPPLL